MEAEASVPSARRRALPASLPMLITPEDEERLMIPSMPGNSSRPSRQSRVSCGGTPISYAGAGDARRSSDSEARPPSQPYCASADDRNEACASRSSRLSECEQSEGERSGRSRGVLSSPLAILAAMQSGRRATPERSSGAGESLRIPRSPALGSRLGRTSLGLAKAISRLASGGRKSRVRNTQADASLASELVGDEGECSKASVDCGDTVISVSFSPDARLFAAGGNRNAVHVHATRDGAHIATLQAQAGVTCIRWAQYGTGTYLIVGTFSGVIRFFDAATAEELAACQWNRGQPIAAMSLSADGTTLAVGGNTSEFVTFRLELMRRGSVGSSAPASHDASPRAVAALEVGAAGCGGPRAPPADGAAPAGCVAAERALNAARGRVTPILIATAEESGNDDSKSSRANAAEPASADATAVGDAAGARAPRPPADAPHPSAAPTDPPPGGAAGVSRLQLALVERARRGTDAAVDAPPLGRRATSGSRAGASEPLRDLSGSDSERTFRVTPCGRAQYKGNVNGIELETATGSLVVVAGEARVVEVYALDTRARAPAGGAGRRPGAPSSHASNPPSARALSPASHPASSRRSSAASAHSSGGGTQRSTIGAAGTTVAAAIASTFASLPASPFRRAKRPATWAVARDTGEADAQLECVLTLRAHFLVSTAVHSIALASSARAPADAPRATRAGEAAAPGAAGDAPGVRRGALERSLLAVGASTHTELWSVLWEPPRAAPPVASSRRTSGDGAGWRPAAAAAAAAAAAVGAGAGTAPRRLAWRCEPIRRIDAAALSGGVAFSASALQLAVAGNERVSVHSIHDGAVLHVYKLAARARCVDLASAGTHVVFGGFDKRATLYRTNAGAELLRFAAPGRGDIVRSVHKLNGLVAIGGESNGSGFARIFGARDEGRQRVVLREWQLRKPVWCVRLSPDRSLCCVGGYDESARVFCVLSGDELSALKYEALPGGPPAFVWSCAWAAERSWLAVGCWNGSCFVYALARTPRTAGGGVGGGEGGAGGGASAAGRPLGGGGKSPVAQSDGLRPAGAAGAAGARQLSPIGIGARASLDVRVVCQVGRRDRVYSVALSADGTRLAVGGRDQCVALYNVDGGELIWEYRDSDFVYAVAISDRRTRVACGGMSKKLTVLHAHTGTALLEMPVGGTVWTVALSADGSRVACGGELAQLSVYETASGGEVAVLPTHEPVYDAQLSETSLCCASGDQGVVYGRGGQSYAWDEGPSYDVAAAIIRSPSTSDEQRLRFLRTTLTQHPTLVNMTERLSRCCLLKMLVESTADPAVISLALSVRTAIGLVADLAGATALDTALEQSNRKTIRSILDAVQQGSISRAPGSIEQVMRNFAALAHAFPHELLRFVKKMPLEAEPEILDDASRSDTVVISSYLVAGSMERAPRGIWEAELRKIRHDQGLPNARADSSLSLQSPLRSPNERAQRAGGGGGAVWPPPLPARCSSRAALAAAPSAARGESPPDAHAGEAPRSALRAAGGSEQRSWHVPGASTGLGGWLERLCPPLAQAWAELDGGGAAGPPRLERRASHGTSAQSPMRSHVPLHAGFGGSSVSSGLAPLRVPLPNLAGWAHEPAGADGARGAGRTSHLALIVAAAVRTRDFSVFDSRAVEALMEYKWRAFAGAQFHQQLFFFTCHLLTLFIYCACMRAAADVADDDVRRWLVDTSNFEGPFLLVGWAWTTVHTVYVIFHEAGQVRHSGVVTYFADEWNVVDLLRIGTQMAISAYLALLVAAPAHMRAAFDASDVLQLGYVDHSGHAHACPPDLVSPMGECPGRAGADDEFTAPFLFDGRVLSAGWSVCLNFAGLSVILNSLKLFNYMRGFAQLGALVQMIQAIISDMVPFMVVLGILVFGFAFALTIIPSGQRRYEIALWQTLNANLYNNFNAQAFFHAGAYSAVLFQCYQLLVQVVLLNLLVAIMADSYRHVKSRTKQAAKFERARVIGEMETSPQLLSILLRKLFQRQEEWVRAPRWLHILDNDERAVVDEEGGDGSKGEADEA